MMTVTIHEKTAVQKQPAGASASALFVSPARMATEAWPVASRCCHKAPLQRFSVQSIPQFTRIPQSGGVPRGPSRTCLPARSGIGEENRDAAARELIRKGGLVYTPGTLANYLASKVVAYFLADLQRVGPRQRESRWSEMKILDPACGDGELLTATWGALLRNAQERAGASDFRRLPKPEDALCGIDNDQEAIRRATVRLAGRGHGKPHLLCTNALFPFQQLSRKGWEQVRRRFAAPYGFDMIVANPPWGADIEEYRDKLELGEFSLFKGQYDTADLFFELALSIVKDGGYLAFILPDSLFSAERAPLRRLLLGHTEIKYIGRFGEKIFPNVNRACAVVICRKGAPAPGNKVRCLRLTPAFRRDILQNKATFEDAERALGHDVPQERFEQNQDGHFDIDLGENERGILGLFRRSMRRFRDYVWSTRGVELSKTGRVCRCAHCRLWMPYPSGETPRCSHCGRSMGRADLNATEIVSSERQAGYEPLLVGETIRRYQLDAQYWLAMNREGIKYKDRSIYQGPKIVVRKTGVGLSATIDYRGALTNQVVYIFKPLAEKDSTLPIEAFLAILNSRAMYYYLAKNHGETEWRSHPYVTQQQILDLPLPGDALESDSGREIANKLGKIVRAHLAAGQPLPDRVDAEVERLVASLYGLSVEHYRAIYATLNSAEELIPIASLKKITIPDIFKS